MSFTVSPPLTENHWPTFYLRLLLFIFPLWAAGTAAGGGDGRGAEGGGDGRSSIAWKGENTHTDVHSSHGMSH